MFTENETGVIILTRESAELLAKSIAREVVANLGSREETHEPLITKAKACEILDRCDSTLSKWAKRGILVPVRRGGCLYYRYDEVMEIYRGERGNEMSDE